MTVQPSLNDETAEALPPATALMRAMEELRANTAAIKAGVERIEELLIGPNGPAETETTRL